MIRNAFLLLVVVVMALPTAIACFTWCLLTGNANPLYKASFFIVRRAFWVAGIRLHVEGLETIPKGTACIFMANHVSNLDPPVLTSCIPGRTSVFYKASLGKIPLLGIAMRMAEFVPVNRAGSPVTAQESTRKAIEVLGKGLHITTFVEGTRSRDGRLLPFKKGPFYLAQQSGAPCIPVSISGTETMMHKGSNQVLPGVAHVVFHPPVYSQDYPDRDGLLSAVRAAIASGLPEWMRGPSAMPGE